jgi:hypothetical protein
VVGKQKKASLKMSLPWFRMYAEAAGDPVLQSLAFDDQRHYFILLCLKCGGTLDRQVAPEQRERIIARGLGLDAVTASEAKRRMMEVSLIDQDWQPLGWDKRQYNSDISTDRVRKYRNNKESGNVSETNNETSKKVSETSVTISVSDSVSVSVSDLETSRFIFNLIRTLNPKHREPNFKSWANDIRLMRECDRRTDEEIRALFEWANQDHFWRTNILSPAKLRKQWDVLVIQRDNPKNIGSNSQQPKPGKMARAAEALRKSHGTAADSATANDRGTGVVSHAGSPARLRADRR